LQICDKKLHSVGFIFDDEAKEVVEIIQKLDPRFNTESDLETNDANNLENVISQFFHDLKSSLNNLLIQKEAGDDVKQEVGGVDKQEVISVKNQETPKNVVTKNPHALSIQQNQSSLSQPSYPITPLNQQQQPLFLNNSSSRDNAEILKELNVLRRKMIDYESIQDELQYYKNLSLSYHKVKYCFIKEKRRKFAKLY
jgi:hypothetical protein